MALVPADIDRYARQIIIPGVGLRGQERIMATHVVVLGSAPGREIALRYARATGFQAHADLARHFDAVIATDLRAISEGVRRAIEEHGRPIVWSAADGNRLRGGVHRPGEAWPPASITAAPADAGIAFIAACETVATLVAWTLGWKDSLCGFEADVG